MTDTDRLAELAAAATPETKGRWRFRWCDFRDGTPRHEYAYVEWGGTDEGFGTAALSPAMAHYLAACDPATIRSLVDDNRELRAALDETQRMLEYLWSATGSRAPDMPVYDLFNEDDPITDDILMTDTDRLTVLAAAAHGEPIVMHPGEFRELVSGIRELIAQRDRLVDDNRELREAAGAFARQPDELRRLSEAATPGPWEADSTRDQWEDSHDDPPDTGWFRGDVGNVDVGDYTTLSWADAAFIAAAVNYVRAVLAASPAPAHDPWCAAGFMMPEGPCNCGAAPEPTGLDAAWAEAEAAVTTTGRSFLRLTHNTYDRDGKHYDYYYAACNWVPGELAEDGSGPTPAAALRALAARLTTEETTDGA